MVTGDSELSFTDDHAERERLHAVRRSLRRRLVAWSLGSIVTGAALAVGTRRGTGSLAVETRGFARQCVTWGAVDLGIVVAGAVAEARPVSDAVAASRSLRRLLWLNSALDVGYLAAGAALVARRRVRGRPVVGDGVGVLVQGAFLLGLDAVHAYRLRGRAD